MADQRELLVAFSDPTRQAVLNLLRRRPSTVGDLADRLPVSRPAVSQHLQVLKSAGLVEEERRGTRHYFRLNPKSLAELRTLVDSMWRDALAVFSDFAEKETLKHGTSRRKTRTDPAKRSRRLPG
ncbi:MAG TPA: metalloregulator ArsR/SmtB family transcription factor [Bryobacteraceae bacterium]|nr:metalloregulator ArsR/SmtB family transcription factor [Bryobacteraceae bacterium]